MSTNKPLSDADINQVAGGGGAAGKPGVTTGIDADAKGKTGTRPFPAKPSDERLKDKDLAHVAAGSSQRSFAVDSGTQRTAPKGGSKGSAEPAV